MNHGDDLFEGGGADVFDSELSEGTVLWES